MSENPLQGRRRASISGSGSLNSSLDNWISQSRDAAGLQSVDKEEEGQRVQKEQDARAAFEADGQRNIDAAKHFLAKNKFADARLSIQRARLVLKKAKVGREPELRALEASIEQAEVKAARSEGKLALSQAEEFVYAKRYEMARERLAEARIAFSRGPPDEEQVMALQQIRDLDVKVESSQWWNAAAPGNGGNAQSTQGSEIQSNGPRSSDELGRKDALVKQTALQRATLDAKNALLARIRKKGQVAPEDEGIKNDESQTKSVSDDGSARLLVAKDSEDTNLLQEKFAEGIAFYADFEKALKDEDTVLAREKLKAAREAFRQSGRISEKEC
mmetsp:Transcript_18488/g.42147  ORF Transcript_18488/g.42147 Transcript_18488/m.42147 type:complete len:331 (-) Transcript_18488:842-1834(-)